MKKFLLSLTVMAMPLFLSAQIFSEDFEGEGTPDGWTINQTNTAETWKPAQTPNWEGEGAFQVQYDSALADQNEDLISPSIDLSSYTNVLLTFLSSSSYYWSIDPNDNYNTSLHISSDGGTNWSEIWNENALAEENGGTFDNFTPYTISVNISEYAGNSDVKLRFNYTGNDGAQWIVDNVILQEIAGEAPGCATLVSPADGTTDVDPSQVLTATWEAPSTGGDVTEYEFFAGNSPDNLESIGTVSETTINLNGIPYGSTIYWTVIPSNLVGDAEGCEIFSFTTVPSDFDPYCGPLEFSSGVEPITHVMFAGIDNVTPATSDVAHENFIETQGQVNIGQSYDITLKGNTVGNFENRFAVFIDWNQDNIFEGENEIIEVTQTITNSTGEDDISAMQTITVPSDAIEGVTRMRVKKIYGTINYLDPCLGTGYGQVEEYSLTVGSLSVDDVALANITSVYPNPAKDMVNIKLSEDFDTAKTTVTLTNLTGKKAAQFTNVNEVNVSNLATGVYVMTITDGKKLETKKLIKK